jgi:hypothetical protein
MAFAPSLHSAHRIRPPEVVAIAVLGQPPALTGRLAGLATARLGAVVLTICRARVRNKNSLQQRHLRRFCGRLIERRGSAKPAREENPKADPQEHPKAKKEEELYGKTREEDAPEENGFSNRPFPPTFIPPLTPPRMTSICGL